MSEDTPKQYLIATEEARTLPVNEILTGRGFITGKSGAGKSNSMSVVAEELLDGGYPLLVVDTDGEYFGLKERYQLLHVGATDRCDAAVSPEHADAIADIALSQNLPVVLDVSGYHDVETSKALIRGVVGSLFRMENDLRKPFLLVVEEMQEYLPQSGGKDELAKLLLRVAKRGRKRGLGLCGLSQRPSAVDKDFITQCDWMVWHRLTWETDVDVVRSILGSEVARAIPELRDGEAYLMTDWDETVERVTFRRKSTYDAGATPDLGSYDQPEFGTVDEAVLSRLGGSAGLDLEPGGMDPLVPTEEPVDGESRPIGTGADGEGFAEELQLVVEEIENPEVETDDPDELARMLQQERKRTEILEAEISELRQIIETTSQDHTLQKQGQAGSGAGAGSSKLFEPQKLDGPAGVLVEAGQLVTYLTLRAGAAIRTGTARVTRGIRPDPHPTPRPLPPSHPTQPGVTDHLRRFPPEYAAPLLAFLAGTLLAGLLWLLLT